MVTWNADSDTVPLHTVLIISDQPDNAATWEALFNQRNCIVLVETKVSDALQSDRLVGQSLMLVDVKLSTSDRNALLKGLRSASRGPILMTVSANTVDDIMEANQAGADECLIDFRADEFMDRLAVRGNTRGGDERLHIGQIEAQT